ncbi:hypothetical protein T439DRAFT_351582 [Meredithblackwellia eburnea MCA 4105]
MEGDPSSQIKHNINHSSKQNHELEQPRRSTRIVERTSKATPPLTDNPSIPGRDRKDRATKSSNMQGTKTRAPAPSRFTTITAGEAQQKYKTTNQLPPIRLDDVKACAGLDEAQHWTYGASTTRLPQLIIKPDSVKPEYHTLTITADPPVEQSSSVEAIGSAVERLSLLEQESPPEKYRINITSHQTSPSSPHADGTPIQSQDSGQTIYTTDSETGELIERDQRFFESITAGRVSLRMSSGKVDSLESLLDSMGKGLASSYRDLRDRLRTSNSAAEFSAFTERAAQAEKQKNMAMVDDIYWLEAFANLAAHPHGQYNQLEWAYSDQIDCKPNASLRLKGASCNSWSNPAILVEFTLTSSPKFTDNYLAKSEFKKLRPSILNTCDLLRAGQQTRSFAVGLSFFGKGGSGSSLVAFLVDRENIRLHVVPSWGQERVPEVAALLSILREASVYELGFSPLFEYRIRRDGREVGNIVPYAVKPPNLNNLRQPNSGAIDITKPLKLVGEPLSSVVESPFSRSTFVSRVEANGGESRVDANGSRSQLVLKLQWVQDSRKGREVSVLEHLWGLNGVIPSSQDNLHLDTSIWYAPKIVHSFLATRSPSQAGGKQIQLSPSTSQSKPPAHISPKNSPSFQLPPPQQVSEQSETGTMEPTFDWGRQRHLEMILMETPPLLKLSIAEPQLLRETFRTAPRALRDAANRGVVHGDLSTNNLMVNEDSGCAFLIDWECGRVLSNTSPHVEGSFRSGTRDTMAVELLFGSPHTLAHDVEAFLLCIIKTITQRLKPLDSKKETWQKELSDLCWDWDAARIKDKHLASSRRDLLTETIYSVELTDLIGKIGHEKLAALLIKIMKVGICDWGAFSFQSKIQEAPVMTKERWKEVEDAVEVDGEGKDWTFEPKKL